MDDDRVWSFEKGLWDGDFDHHRDLVDDACLMVLPHPPFVLAGKQAIEAVAHTPRWSDVAFSKAQIACPQAGNIVVACCVRAAKDDETYEAEGTSTYRRLESEVWHFIQDQQTPPLAKAGTVEIRG